MTLFALPYLPPVSWCAAVWNREKIDLEACEHYQKGSLRNRCHIAGPNGIQRLSIPLAKGKHQQTPIREVRIASDEAWQRQHWRSIRTAYGNAPFFEHYADELVVFYERPYAFLFDFNLELLHWALVKKSGWKGDIALTDAWHSPGAIPLDEDFREAFPGSHDAWPGFFQPAHYPQVFEDRFGFLPNLSVLDLLFCCGKQGTEVLERSLL